MNAQELYELFQFVECQHSRKINCLGWYDITEKEREFWRDLAARISKRK